MSQPGSEASHDKKIVELLGEHAEAVLSAPVAYPPLDAARITAALEAGKTCRVKTTSARILLYGVPGSDLVGAIVTELRHGGYRRAYQAYRAPTVPALLEQLGTPTTTG